MKRLTKFKNAIILTRLLYILFIYSFLILFQFQVWHGIFFNMQTLKVLFLCWGVVVIAIIGGVNYWFIGKFDRFAFTATYLLLSLILLYTCSCAVWIKPVQHTLLFILQWLILFTLYFIFQGIGVSCRLSLVIFLMMVVALQAIYVNPQLYNISPSYNKLFKLNGGSLNLGTYSEHLVSTLPVVLVIWFSVKNYESNKKVNILLSPTNYKMQSTVKYIAIITAIESPTCLASGYFSLLYKIYTSKALSRNLTTQKSSDYCKKTT